MFTTNLLLLAIIISLGKSEVALIIGIIAICIDIFKIDKRIVARLEEKKKNQEV